MLLSNLKLHWTYFILLLAVQLSTLSFAYIMGTTKDFSEINWLDTLGEGGITLMTLAWLIATLLSRPKGKVTTLLFLGIGAMHISMLLDFLDEFFRFNASITWLTSLEAFPAVFGMMLMSLALYFWHQEQALINHSLQKRERFYREHSLYDFISGLYAAKYMKRQIENELSHFKKYNTPFCLAIFDVKGFSHYNREFGNHCANHLLSDIGHIVAVNIRQSDLACRYAADRFIILFPQTELTQAKQIAQQVNNLLEQHVSYQHEQIVRTEVNWTCIVANKQLDVTDNLNKLNHQLSKQKKMAA